MVGKTLTIYHNPKCSTSRKVLAALRDSGHAPVIVEYLKTPPSRSKLKELIGAMEAGVRPRDVVRWKEPLAKELGLEKDDSDSTLLAAMAENPILIERPIVTDGKCAVLCRPPERVADVAG